MQYQPQKELDCGVLGKRIQLEITMLGKIGQTSKCKCDIFSLTWSILGEKYARQNIEEEKGDLGGKKGLNRI